MRRKISIILVLCSVILIAAGLAMGASTGMYWDATGLHLSEKIPHEKQVLASFSNLKVDASSAAVEVIYGEEFSIEYYKGANAPVISLDGDTFIVKQGPHGFFLTFGFTLFRTDTIKITLPHGTKLENCNIITDNGQIKITGQTADVLTVNADNGRVVLSHVTAPYTEIICQNGELKFDNVRADYLGAHLDNGSISGTGLTADKFKISVNNGEVKIQSVSLGKGTINADNGSIKASGTIKNLIAKVGNGAVNLSLAKADAYYHFLCRNGSISVDKSHKGSFWESGDPANPDAIRVDAGNGHIKVDIN